VLEDLLDGGLIKGLAHITGGGLSENIPRILPEGTGVEIQLGSWPVLPVFKVMQEIGNVAEREMFRAFNMGVGMVIIGAEPDAAKIKAQVESSGEACYQIGRVTKGDQKVSYAR
jgi:phosphoribosylformylglycinamidine cyclo-ligase